MMTNQWPQVQPTKVSTYGSMKVELDLATPALGNDETIYTSSNNLYTINPDGTEKWVVDLPGNSLFSFSVDKNDNIYFGTPIGSFYSLTPNGELLVRCKVCGKLMGAGQIVCCKCGAMR